MNRGCLSLFALPFAAVGVGMAGWIGWTVIQVARARSWVETPARILQVQLEQSEESQRATARYSYVVAGRSYEGTRVSFYGGADNIGTFHRDVHRELSRYRAPAAPEAVERGPEPAGPVFRCYVNPRDPTQAVLYRDLRVPMLLFQLMFGLIFGGAGFGLLIGNRVSAARERRRRELAAQQPGKPWLWRPDWAAGLIRANRSPARRLVVFTVFWNAISFPIAFFAVADGLGEGRRIALIALIFPLIGLGLAIAAAGAWLRLRRFGGATLQLATVPGVIGGKLAGLVRLPARVRPAGGFRLRLVCAETVSTGSGDDRRQEERVLWEEEQILAADALRGPTPTALPVLFGIPFDQSPTDPDSATPVAWRLEVKARMPGPDLSVQFELPVFVTPESAPDFVLDRTPLTPLLARIDPHTELREAGVRMEATARGVAFVFPRARFPGQAVLITLFTLFWTTIVVGMLIARARGGEPPLIFPIGFGFFDLFLLWAVLEAWLGHGRIEVDREGLRWSRTVLGLGPRGAVPAGQPLELEVIPGTQVGYNLRYVVVLAGHKAGRSTRISGELSGRHAAEMLAAEIRRAATRADPRAFQAGGDAVS